MKKIILFPFSCGLLLTSAWASTPSAQLLSRLPLRFEENRSAPPSSEVTYVAHGGNFDLSLGPSESWFDMHGQRVRMGLDGGNSHARMEPLERLPGVANYFLGSEKKNWKTGVTGYGRIRSASVYPGIDLIFHGEGGRLEYDFIVAPQADPGSIRLEFNGQKRLRVDAGGDLLISTDSGEIRWKHPEIYQDVNGKRRSVAGHFVVSRNRVRFEIGRYDRGKELVIDPVLTYSSYLGGAGNDGARGIAVDGSGNVYVVGNTTTTNLPITSGVVQPNFGGETAVNEQGDAFVAKFSAAGALVYLTYLGGSGDDSASAVAVDTAGNAYITGFTTSTNFPMAGTPFQSQFAGGGPAGAAIVVFGDAFVAKLNPSGSQLIYSTYLGGSQDDFGTAIAIDNLGNAYVAGGSRSTNFPTTSGAYQTALAGVGGQLIKSCCGLPLFDPGDAFVTELNPTGSRLVFSTYLGGEMDDVALTIALDSSNNIYIGGFTLSLRFPTTTGGFQRSFGGSEPANQFFTFGDGFVTKLNSTGAALVYSTYFGGSGDDSVTALTVDAAGNAYFTGSTSTENWATSAGAFQPTYGGYTENGYNGAAVYVEQLIGDAYVAKLNPTGTGLVYMSYLGGSFNDGGTGIAVDSAGNAYVTGFADSTNFPITNNALQTKMAGDGGQAQGSYYRYGDAFVTVVNPTATALIYSSYFGGLYDDGATSLALDSSGTVHIAGITISLNLPTTANAAQKTYGGVALYAGWAKGDAFVSSFSGLITAPATITEVANAFGESPIIAPNTWVFIKGTNLAPAGVSSPDCAPGYCWQGTDFMNNQLPTMLQGVSVTMNQENAYLYYISPGQINILTPPDLPLGPVTVQVNNNGTVSQSFTVQAQEYSESFFVYNGGPYVVAAHLPNYNIVGPTTLFPGFSTPAQRGETIVIVANGFGPVTPPVVKGSEAQSGSLPSPPLIQIGTGTAALGFHGLVSPGVYQFNVTIPPDAPSGDLPIKVTYGGFTTQAGTLITVQ